MIFPAKRSVADIVDENSRKSVQIQGKGVIVSRVCSMQSGTKESSEKTYAKENPIPSSLELRQETFVGREDQTTSHCRFSFSPAFQFSRGDSKVVPPPDFPTL